MRLLTLTALCLFACLTSSRSAEPERRVLIIGIDGCRPDALEAARTPHIDRLIAQGAYFADTDIREPDATDDADTVSGPGWSNLLTGVWPDKHGVLDNKFTEPRYEQYPHLFARVKSQRPAATTASFSTWAPILEKITTQADIGKNFANAEKDYARADREATDACLRQFKEQLPHVTVFYQGQIDEAGHAHGFHPTVPEYIAAIEQVDTNVGDVLKAIDAQPEEVRRELLVIVCTDHGGLGLSHGGGRKESDIRRTFLIVSGARARKGRIDEETWQVDVVATALAHLGIEPPAEWGLDGQPRGLAK
ncbi:MAG: alkaline phosphatase family protein [Planctomycetaceae bacterium]